MDHVSFIANCAASIHLSVLQNIHNIEPETIYIRMRTASSNQSLSHAVEFGTTFSLRGLIASSDARELHLCRLMCFKALF